VRFGLIDKITVKLFIVKLVQLLSLVYTVKLLFIDKVIAKLLVLETDLKDAAAFFQESGSGLRMAKNGSDVPLAPRL